MGLEKRKKKKKEKDQYNKFTLHGSLLSFHFGDGWKNQQQSDWNFKWQHENLASCLLFRSHHYASFYPSFRSSFPKREKSPPGSWETLKGPPVTPPCTGTPFQIRFPVPKPFSWQLQGVWLLEKSPSMFNSPQLTFPLPNCLSIFEPKHTHVGCHTKQWEGKKRWFFRKLWSPCGAWERLSRTASALPFSIRMGRPWCLHSTTILNLPQKKLLIRSWEHAAGKKAQICKNPFFHSISLEWNSEHHFHNTESSE